MTSYPPLSIISLKWGVIAIFFRYRVHQTKMDWLALEKVNLQGKFQPVAPYIL
jgi:hypothetical protein